MRNISASESDLENQCVLREAAELAGPHLNLVVIVNDGVIGFETAVMEVLGLVDSRVVVVGEIWS